MLGKKGERCIIFEQAGEAKFNSLRKQTPGKKTEDQAAD